MKEEFYAHSREGKSPQEWHRLEDHLKKVAELARSFAHDFKAGDWAYLAGLWHDPLTRFSTGGNQKRSHKSQPE